VASRIPLRVTGAHTVTLWVIISAVALPLALSELGEISPWAARRLLTWGARRLPGRQQSERYREEWLAGIEEVPGKLTKLAKAISIVCCMVPIEITRARRAGRVTKLPSTTWVVVMASVMGGAFTLLVVLWRNTEPTHIDQSQWIIAAAIGILALGTGLWPVVVLRGSETEAFTLDEGFFVILALLVPPLITLGTLGVATVLAQVGRRRSAFKSAFNVGQVLIAAGLGLAVSRSIAPPSDSPTAAQIAAVMLGAGVYFVINQLLMGCVFVSMGTAWREFTSDLRVSVTLAGAGAPTGAVLAVAIHAQLWVVALAIPVLIVERQLISAFLMALRGRAHMGTGNLSAYPRDEPHLEG
jgi:hypothetical protein